jgi:hypothetical protein
MQTGVVRTGTPSKARVRLIANSQGPPCKGRPVPTMPCVVMRVLPCSFVFSLLPIRRSSARAVPKSATLAVLMYV